MLDVFNVKQSKTDEANALQEYIDKVVEELKQAIQNGTIKIEVGNSKLFKIVKAGGENV